MIILDEAKNKMSSKYKYQQVAEQIKEEILNKQLLPNTHLPSVREYAEAYSVNVNTIVHAMHLLRIKGIVYSDRTKGYYVASNIELQKRELTKVLVIDFCNTMFYLGFEKEELLAFIQNNV